MDPTLFKQQLEQYAELKVIAAPRTSGMKEADEAVIIERHGTAMTIDPENNHTLQWRIKNLKNTARVCEDCYKIVDNRIVEIKRYDVPELHWRKLCKNCNLVCNPYNKKFELPVKASHHVHACWVTDKLEPNVEQLEQEKCSISRPVFKKPAK